MIVSPLHPGIYIPRSGLDHPLYDSVFANASELQDERTIETRLTGVRHPAIMIESSHHEGIVHAADSTSSQELSSHDDQTAQLHVSSNVIYDNRSVTSYRRPGDNVVSSDHSTESVNNSLPDNASFIFYDKRPTD